MLHNIETDCLITYSGCYVLYENFSSFKLSNFTLNSQNVQRLKAEIYSKDNRMISYETEVCRLHQNNNSTRKQGIS